MDFEAQPRPEIIICGHLIHSEFGDELILNNKTACMVLRRKWTHIFGGGGGPAALKVVPLVVLCVHLELFFTAGLLRTKSHYFAFCLNQGVSSIALGVTECSQRIFQYEVFYPRWPLPANSCYQQSSINCVPFLLKGSLYEEVNKKQYF